MERNGERIEKARKKGTLPWFLRDNEGMWKSEETDGIGKHKETKESSENINRLIEKIRTQKTDGVGLFVSFEPFSPIIMQYLGKLRKAKERETLFKEILSDDSFVKREESPLTLIHPNHKKKGCWQETLKMGEHINRNGDVVAFLPKYEDKTSADAITKINGRFKIVDFKYCVSTNWNTISMEIAKGFSQAEAVVVQLKNADSGQFKEAIKYLKRNKMIKGELKLMNKYGKCVDLSVHDMSSGRYEKKIKGFL